MNNELRNEVIDDFLPEADFRAIQEFVFSSDFPWFYLDRVSGLPDDISDIGFAHILHRNHTPTSDFSHRIIGPLVNAVRPKALIRVRASLYLKGPTLIEHSMHTDYPFSHQVFMLYLNTNNGYTTFSDGKIVQCKENRAVFFDGGVPHKSSNCTDQDRRVTLTMNYL
jgi:hypothetical protein